MCQMWFFYSNSTLWLLLLISNSILDRFAILICLHTEKKCAHHSCGKFLFRPTAQPFMYLSKMILNVVESKPRKKLWNISMGYVFYSVWAFLRVIKFRFFCANVIQYFNLHSYGSGEGCAIIRSAPLFLAHLLALCMVFDMLSSGIPYEAALVKQRAKKCGTLS